MKIGVLPKYFPFLYCLLIYTVSFGVLTKENLLNYSKFVDILEENNIEVSPAECFHNCRVDRERQFSCRELLTTLHVKDKNCYDCKPKGLFAQSRIFLFNIDYECRLCFYQTFGQTTVCSPKFNFDENIYSCEFLCEIQETSHEFSSGVGTEVETECKFPNRKAFESCKVCRLKKEHRKLKSTFGPFLKSGVYFSPTGDLNLKKFCSEKCFSSKTRSNCNKVIEKRMKETGNSEIKKELDLQIIKNLIQSCENSCEKSLIEAVDCREKNSSSVLPFKRCYKCINKVSNSLHNFDCEKCLAKDKKCASITTFDYPDANC
jgi:hypothetical protein